MNHITVFCASILACIALAGCVPEQEESSLEVLGVSAEITTEPTALFDGTVKTVVYRNDEPPIARKGEILFGSAVVALGDWDGDGPVAQVIAVSDGNYSPPGISLRGAVHLLFINEEGALLSHKFIDPVESGGPANLQYGYTLFGHTLAFLGDLDGPGQSVAVLAVGAIGYYEPGRVSEYDQYPGGGVFLLYLLSDGSVLRWAEISSSTPNGPGYLVDYSHYGAAVTSLGDWDGPGGSVHTIAVGSPFDTSSLIPEEEIIPTVYFHGLNADGSILHTTTLNANTQGMPANRLGRYSQFGRALAFIPQERHEESLLIVGAFQGGYDLDIELPQFGELYLFRLHRDFSIADVKIINTSTQNAPPHTTYDGSRISDYLGSDVASLQPLLGRNIHNARYLIAAATNATSTDRFMDYHILALHDDLSIASFNTIDGFFGNGIPAPRGYGISYGRAFTYVGPLNPATPDVHAIAVTGNIGETTDVRSLFLHFVKQ